MNQDIEDTQIENIYAIIYIEIDTRNWEAIDKIINALDINTAKVSVLLSALTITAWSNVRCNIKTRDQFYTKIYERLTKERGSEATEQLLQGLK